MYAYDKYSEIVSEKEWTESANTYFNAINRERSGT